MYKRLIVLCFALGSATPGSPSPAQAHVGRLDEFGCHHDQDQKYYHCHEGPYRQLSFDSKTQMIQRLRNQYIALGRTWPFGDATNTVEQPGAIVETTIEQPQTVPVDASKEARPGNRLQPNHLGRVSLKELAKTNRQRSQTHSKTETTVAQKAVPKPSEVRRKRTEPELKVWVTQIRADGRPIFESKEGERFLLDESGNKVLIERRES